MKSTKMILVVASAAAMFSFSSCNDNDKRGDNEQMRNDSIRMAEENRLEQERMDMESNSVFAMVQEDTVLTTFSTNLENNQLSQTFLSGEGPYTIFAPSNDAYQNLSQQERDAFNDPQNREESSARLHYLVINEELTTEDLRSEIEAATGEYTLTTMQGEQITASLEGDTIVLTDAAGNTARLTETDNEASNGVIHVIDGVLNPSDPTKNAAGQMQNQNSQNRGTANDTVSNNSNNM